MKKKKAILLLEDGKEFFGYSFGAEGEIFGEIVFNTSMTGYQEIMTDPSYAGQIVAMTYPEIGNYGTNKEDYESRKPFIEGFIVREASFAYSSWRAKKSINEFLFDSEIIGIESIDTRRLTKHIRLAGAMKGAISTLDFNKESLLEKIEMHPSIVGRDLVKEVTIDKSYWWENEEKGKFKVAVFDSGIKYSILRELKNEDCALYVVPASTPAEEVLKVFNPDGIFFANGPGDPQGAPYLFKTLRYFLGKKPVFGICLGNQMLGLALGGETFKLKFGHRGANHPVKNLSTDRVEITSQNHGFALDPKSLKINDYKWQVGEAVNNGASMIGETDFGRVELTHINLNDGTVEGIRCLDIPAFSVQYHPEASPGPHDSKYLFKEFIELMKNNN